MTQKFCSALAKTQWPMQLWSQQWLSTLENDYRYSRHPVSLHKSRSPQTKPFRSDLAECHRAFCPPGYFLPIRFSWVVSENLHNLSRVFVEVSLEFSDPLWALLFYVAGFSCHSTNRLDVCMGPRTRELNALTRTYVTMRAPVWCRIPRKWHNLDVRLIEAEKYMLTEPVLLDGMQMFVNEYSVPKYGY